MTDRRSYARLAADLLARAEPEVGAPTAEQRTAAIDLIAKAIADKARARRRRGWVYGIAAAAASIGLLFAARSLPFGRSTGVVAHGGGGVTLSHGGTTAPLHDGAQLARGDRLHVEKGAAASLALSTGTHVEVEGGSDVTLLAKDGDQIFGIEAGATRFVVAKVAPGKRFLVRTADLEVEVRGTAFRVAYGEPACEGTTSRVVVTEGLVVVRKDGHEHLVGAGARWPASCDLAAAPPTQSAASAPAVAALSGVPSMTPPSVKPTTVAHSGTTGATPGKPAGSDLAEQNDLFAEATTKQRAGDRAGAARAFERFLARWPGSALAETAAIERMRLVDGGARREAAKTYLARWPSGAARAEAETILAK